MTITSRACLSSRRFSCCCCTISHRNRPRAQHDLCGEHKGFRFRTEDSDLAGWTTSTCDGAARCGDVERNIAPSSRTPNDSTHQEETTRWSLEIAQTFAFFTWGRTLFLLPLSDSKRRVGREERSVGEKPEGATQPRLGRLGVIEDGCRIYMDRFSSSARLPRGA